MTTDTWTRGNLRIELQRDEHANPGIAHTRASWVDTGHTGHWVRLERWADGCWRALSTLDAHPTPHDAAEAFFIGRGTI